MKNSLFLIPFFFCSSIAFLLSGCTVQEDETIAKTEERKQPEPLLSGVDPKTIYTLQRISGTEGEEDMTVIEMSIENYKKIKDSIEILETKYTGTEGSTSYITFLDEKELNDIKEKYPNIPWDSYAQVTESDTIQMKEEDFDEISGNLFGAYTLEKKDRERKIVFFKIKYPGFNLQRYKNEYPNIPWETYSFGKPNSFRICEHDYNRLKDDLEGMNIKKNEDHNILAKINPSDLEKISQDLLYNSMSVGKDGFLIYRNIFNTFKREFDLSTYNNSCDIGETSSEMVMANIIDQVFDPTLYAFRLPSEINPNPVNPNDEALYFIKVRPELLLNPDTGISSLVPHYSLNYNLSSNTSPYSLIVVSTTEKEILKAKEEGVVWWYERYHPAYKMDVRKLYDPLQHSLYPEGDQNLVTVQVTFHMPEGVSEETVAKKRSELKQLAINLNVPRHKYAEGVIVERTLFHALDTYEEKDDKYFGTDYVEPREGVQIPWEEYKGANTFPMLLPQFPLKNIKLLLKREDVIQVETVSISQEGKSGWL